MQLNDRHMTAGVDFGWRINPVKMFITIMCASKQLKGQLQAEVNLLLEKQPAAPLYMRLGGRSKQFETNILLHRR